MRIDISVEWDLAPAVGRFEFTNAVYVGGGINVGWGQFSSDDLKFSFTSVTESCRIVFAIDVNGETLETNPPLVKVSETKNPFIFSVMEAVRNKNGELRISGPAVTVAAEINTWASL